MQTENYRHRLGHLRRAPSGWSDETRRRAPHKPFLLLAVMDLIAQGEIQSNFIELSPGLMDAFDLYWVRVIGQERRSTPALPFFHLKNEGFWHLIPAPGKERELTAMRQVKSLDHLQHLILGARLDDELFTVNTPMLCVGGSWL